MWPDIRFDCNKLFDLHVSDLLIYDPYYISLCVNSYMEMGDDLFISLLNAPDVLGYICEVCPECADWLREGVYRLRPQPPERIREAEARLIAVSSPWNLAMAKSPETWDALTWSYWDPSVIYDRVELTGKTVLDIGAGTGQVTLRCAPFAAMVWALEPVARLRRYIERKTGAANLHNIRTLSGVLENIPLADNSVDVSILSNGSFGWNPDKELHELERVTSSGGTILMLGPCNFSNETVIASIHQTGGYEQFEFEVPGDGVKPAFIKRM